MNIISLFWSWYPLDVNGRSLWLAFWMVERSWINIIFVIIYSFHNLLTIILAEGARVIFFEHPLLCINSLPYMALSKLKTILMLLFVLLMSDVFSWLNLFYNIDQNSFSSSFKPFGRFSYNPIAKDLVDFLTSLNITCIITLWFIQSVLSLWGVDRVGCSFICRQHYKIIIRIYKKLAATIIFFRKA